MVKRITVFVYGVVCYAVFFATFLYAIGFIGGFLTPTRLDGAPTTPLGSALAINLGLLGLFAVQHSVMARPAFKRMWTRIIPRAAERSTYTLASSLALIALFALWQPIGGQIWSVDSTIGQAALYSLYAFGWALVLFTTFLINHFDLFGLRQVWLFLRGERSTELKFVTPGPYKHVRHPLYVGWLIVFWATPHMSAAHLVFAIATTAYIFIGIFLEERDLVAAHGADYENYRKRVPMIVPRLRAAQLGGEVAVGGIATRVGSARKGAQPVA